MKDTRILMGMPVTVELVDSQATQADLDQAYAQFMYVDETFSTYKATSEISLINANELPESQWSADMQFVMEQCALTKKETNGYFEIVHNGTIDPSGYVKGWAIQNVGDQLREKGLRNWYVEAGGDLQVSGNSSQGLPWILGIRNPFKQQEIIKRVSLEDKGMATSGTYVRGQHIYDPHAPEKEIAEVVSLTVIGARIVDADRYATAAFAMGAKGVGFIANLPGFEGYQIDAQGIATFTPGFNAYVI
jgi:thiamine biosynthesis lipoprotein